MERKLFWYCHFIISIILTARPTGTIKRLEGIQEQFTHKPIIFFKVIFSEPVLGFSQEVVEVYSTDGTTSSLSDATVSMAIYPNASEVNDTFIVSVSGLSQLGYFLSIPENSVLSADDLSANAPIYMAGADHVVYFSHMEEFFYVYSNDPNTFLSKEISTINVAGYPSSQFEFKLLSILDNADNARKKVFKFTNHDSKSKMAYFDVDSPPKLQHFGFEIYKDTIPEKNIQNIKHWICGGSNQKYYTDQLGKLHLYSYCLIQPGQSIYLLCHTENEKFGVRIEGLPQTSFYNNVTLLDDYSQEKIWEGPNPINSTIQITSNNMEKAFLIDNTGKLVLESTNTSIDVSDLDSGLYYLKIIENGKSAQHKLIKK